MRKALGLMIAIQGLFIMNAVAAGDSVPYVSGVNVTSQNAALGQTGQVTLSLTTQVDCAVEVGFRASVQKVPSMAPGYPMDALVISVYPVVKNCGGTYVAVAKTVSILTSELIEKALKTVDHPNKEVLPVTLNLPSVQLR